MISVGAKNEEIADKLFISPNTVKTHIYNISKRLMFPTASGSPLCGETSLTSHKKVLPAIFSSTVSLHFSAIFRLKIRIKIIHSAYCSSNSV
jgi:hypothetical protein